MSKKWRWNCWCRLCGWCANRAARQARCRNLRGIAALISARKPHGMLQVLGLEELDIDADVFRQTTGEQPRLLQHREVIGMCGTGLKLCHVRVHQSSERQPRQVGEVVGAEGRAEALLTHATEVRPRGAAYVAFQDDVPLLSHAREVIRCEPDLVHLPCHLAAEKLLTLVEPAERVLFVVIGGEREFVVLWHNHALYLQR